MKKTKVIPLFFIVTFSLAVISVIIGLISKSNVGFADFINRYPAHFLRFLLAKIFSVFPFSFMEFLLFMSPVILITVIVIAVRSALKSWKSVIYAFLNFFGIACIVFCLFKIGYEPGYYATPLSDKMGLDRRDVSAEELYETETLIIEKVNEAAAKIEFNVDGSSTMPFSYSELSSRINDDYEKIYEKYDFIYGFRSPLKRLIISPIMTYTHLSGLYSFFTGESNINTNYPDFVVVYSAAHELAHQRGISREDEANFTAFLVCLYSSDDYIRYCAYLNMYEYLANALYTADAELYFTAYDTLCPEARGELAAYSRFFDKYRENVAADVTDTLNDAYLQAQGTQGVRSYGMVVDLAVAYYKNNTD